MMFKRAEQMEVAWSKIGAIRRMLEDFPLEISQRLICLVGSMRTRVDKCLNVQGDYVEK
jgi:hypothetical protein